MAKKKKIRTTYLNYDNPNTKSALDRAVIAKLRADSDETETDFTGCTFILPATVRRHAIKENLVENNTNCEGNDLFVKQSRSVSQHGLTTPAQRIFLQNVSCLSDRDNN